MDELNWKELDQIPIPEGLEERLSAKIDEWEDREKRKVNGEPSVQRIQKSKYLFPSYLKVTAIAASVALVFGVGYYFLSHEEPVNLAEQDTYQDPVVAQQEAEKALNLLAYNLNKGMGQLEKAKAISDRTELTLNKQLQVLEK